MSLSRRQFLNAAASAATISPALARGTALKIGVTDWNLKQTGNPEAVSLARRLGFEGVQVSLGRRPVDAKLPLDNAELQAQYIARANSHNIKIDGTCLDILHVNYLKNDPLGPKWVADGIRITQALHTQVMLLPFFGKGALDTPEEMNAVADVLRELGPEAESRGVILGIENTISAEDNVRIMERARSKSVKVYYDVGNSTAAGFDPVKEIRWLGKDKICQFHFKDEPGYLGEGKIDFGPILHAILDMNYQGYANLETSAPSKSIEGDLRRNLAFVRKLMEQMS